MAMGQALNNGNFDINLVLRRRCGYIYIDMAPQEFKIDVNLKRSEVIWYNLNHIKALLIADLIGFIIFVYLVYSSFTHPQPETRDLFETLSIWVAVGLVIGFSQPMIVLLQVLLAKSPALENLMAQRSYIFKDDSIEIGSLGRKAVKKWGDIVKISRTLNLVLIFTSKKMAYVIPRRCFANKTEWRRFNIYLREMI